VKLIKLTEKDGTTQNGFEWRKGKVNKVKHCDNPQLCSGDVLHAYTNINLAFLLNPIHGDKRSPRAYEVEGDVVVKDWGKVGCFEMRVLKRLKKPEWVGHKKEGHVRIMFAILCAEAVLHHFEGKHPKDDRPRKAIEAAKEYLKNPSDAAYDAAGAAAYDATGAAAEAAARAAWAAYDAARAAYDAAYAAAYAAAYDAAGAARAARAAGAARAARAAGAARAARAAGAAAEAAARAAYDAAEAAWAAGVALDFASIADKAVKLI
jgi:hypothetical protein